MGSYTLALEAFAKKFGQNADKVVRKVVLDIGTRIVERSPVGDGSLWKHPPPKGYVGGRFRANWQYGNYSSAGIPMQAVDTIDPTGGASIARLMQCPVDGAGGMRHVIINNLPYAIPLEHGWSKQAPAGMVGITVLEFQQIVAEAASEVKGST